MAPLLVAGAQATESWIGGVGSFHEPTNWSGGSVPGFLTPIEVTNGGTVLLTNTGDVADTSVGGGSTFAVLPGASSLFKPEELYLGTFGTGTLTLGSQSVMEPFQDVYIGYASGATGVMTMTGAELRGLGTFIGYQGNGSLTVENGSELGTYNARVGYLPGSTGFVHISDSTWQAETGGGFAQDITVGAQGNGEIQAANSSISFNDLILGDSTGATGTVTASGGTLTSDYDGTPKSVVVGNNGTGNLTLSNSATLTAASLSVGVLGNGTGTVTISGGHAELTGALNVGQAGTGTVTLQAAGTLVSDSANVGGQEDTSGTVNVQSGIWTNKETMTIGLEGEGTLNIGATGAAETRNATIGKYGQGTVSITGTGAVLNVTETLVVGENGRGNVVSLLDGGEISSNSSQIGLNAFSTAVVDLDDAGWTTVQTLTIGGGGVGEFNARNGSLVEAGAVVVGAVVEGEGSLLLEHSSLITTSLTKGPGFGTVTFDGGTLVLAQTFVTPLFNGFNAGDVTIEAGGIAIDTQSFNAGTSVPLSGAGGIAKVGSGTLVLDAVNTYAGGTFVGEGVLVLVQGASGTGAITMGTATLNGFGDMNLSTTPSVAIQDNQTATFMTEPGQTFTLSPTNFAPGGNSTAVFGSTDSVGTIIFEPGSVTASTDYAVVLQSGNLTAGNNQLAELTAEASSTTVAAGTTLDFQDNLSVGGISNLLGAGTVLTGTNSTTTLTINSGNFSGSIAGAGGMVKASSGTLFLSGFSQLAGGTTVEGGTLVANGALDTTVEVKAGGTLGGTGLVGPVTLNGGTLSPGNSPGTFLPEDVLWYDGIIVFELGPTAATSDFINTGRLDGLSSSSKYAFNFVDQGIVLNTTYDLITFTSTTITNISDFEFLNGGGFAGNFAYNGNTLQFSLTAVPEPSTWALILTGAAFLVARTRRRARER